MLARRFCSLCSKEPLLIRPLKGKRVCTTNRRNLTNSEVRKKRNALFDEEKNRQLGFVKRIEKVKVNYIGEPENCTLLMNKSLSTPYNCAMHMHEFLMNRSVAALVNNKLWDMHRPLEEDCDLQLLHMLNENCHVQNKIFWRTCSFLLGHILETSFKDDYYVELCSFPKADVQSGSFVYDVNLHIPNWAPTERELLCLSLEMHKMIAEDYHFERLSVPESVAVKIFEDNKFKSQQIPLIAATSHDEGTVTLYRAGEHIDICRGPLISSTGQIGRFHVTEAHDIESEEYGKLKRFQGIALPKDIQMHHWTFELLQKFSKIPNPAPPPGLPDRKLVPELQHENLQKTEHHSEGMQR